MAKLSKKKVKNSAKGTLGIISAIAKKCGVTRQALYLFLNKPENADCIEAIEEEREGVIDVAEIRLSELVKAGDFNAIKLLLTTKGRSRGYGEIKDFHMKADSTAAEELNKIFKECQNDNEPAGQDSLHK